VTRRWLVMKDLPEGQLLFAPAEQKATKVCDEFGVENIAFCRRRQPGGRARLRGAQAYHLRDVLPYNETLRLPATYLGTLSDLVEARRVADKLKLSDPATVDAAWPDWRADLTREF